MIISRLIFIVGLHYVCLSALYLGLYPRSRLLLTTGLRLIIAVFYLLVLCDTLGLVCLAGLTRLLAGNALLLLITGCLWLAGLILFVGGNLGVLSLCFDAVSIINVVLIVILLCSMNFLITIRLFYIERL